ncbi:cuticle protein 16.8 [Trichonephila clavipes]|nr:cuticle protein 16.8 [Trichonephila clavipes]
MINGRTHLHVVANGTMTGQRYIDEILLPHFPLFRGAVGDKFVFMEDNATCQRILANQDCLDSEGIQRLVWPACSPDLNPIESVWDALGRQVAGRNYPTTNKNTLIRALTEEWDKLPQQLLDNVVESMAFVLAALAVTAFASLHEVSPSHHHAPQPYKFGYSIKDHHGKQHREESGDGGHAVRGSYGFTDARGIHRQVHYVADHGGFRAEVKTNEPGTANQNPAAVHLIFDAPYTHGGYAGAAGLGYDGIGYAGYGGLLNAGYGGLGYAGYGGLGYVGYGGYDLGYGGNGLGILGGLGYARYGY